MESLGRMVLDIENMKREFRKFYQLAESLTGMQNDLNQFRKVASDVRQMKTAMSQLQVSAKLNGNAVARIFAADAGARAGQHGRFRRILRQYRTIFVRYCPEKSDGSTV